MTRSVALALAGAIAVVCLGGCSAVPATAPGTSDVPTVSVDAPPSSRPRLPGITGQITAENGDSWTVQTSYGQTYTVMITPATRFGSRNHPATREQFKVGSRARIRGTISGTAVTATQVSLPATLPSQPAASR